MARDLRGESEFGRGPGMIDPERRKTRELNANPLMDVGEDLREIYATNPAKAGEDLSTVQVDRP